MSRLRPALLGSLDHGAGESVDGFAAGLSDASRGLQRNKAGGAQFDGLFDEPSLTVPLGKRHAESDRTGQFTIHGAAPKNGNLHHGAAQSLDPGGELVTRAIEENQFVARLGPHHVEQVMSLGPPQHGRFVLLDRDFNKIAM